MAEHDSSLAAALRAGMTGDVRFDALSRVLYRTDASIYEIEPRGLVLPSGVPDVVHAIRVAAERGVPVLPRGAGTSLSGQAVGPTIVLDLSRHMNRVLELNLEEGWVRVEPGVVLDQLNAHLKPHGLMFGPDVSTSSRANLGGMIGNNSAGSYSIVYGRTIDHVLDLTAVLADGSVVLLGPVDAAERRRREELGSLEGQVYREVGRVTGEYAEEVVARYSKVMRRVAGYSLDYMVAAERDGRDFDLSRLVVGSEGTLCAVVEARLRVVPTPPKRAVIACHFHDLVEAMRATVALLETGPAAIELGDRILLDQTRGSIEHAPRRRFVQGDPEALLMVEYFGESAEALARRLDDAEAMLREAGLGYAFVQALDPAEQRDMWELRKAGLGLLMGMAGDAKPTSGVEDTCVPAEVLPEYVTRVQELMRSTGVRATIYGHASVGVLHIRPILDLKTADGVRLLRHFGERISDLVLEYGGSMSAEHGDGLARSEWIGKMFGPRLVRAFEEVKAAFDPAGIMNPGKIVRAPRMDQNLRYGEGHSTLELDTYFRFDREGGFQRAVEMCSGVGQCRKRLVGTMCPSYMATLEEEHSTRGRANALRAALNGRPGFTQGLASEELRRVMDLCLECKACKAECPSSVDMAKLKYEFLAQHGKVNGFPWRSHLFGRIDRINRWLSPVALLANATMGSGPVRWLLEQVAGIDRRRRMPPLARQRFSRWFRRRTYRRGGRRGTVVLFNDTFVEYNEPQIGMAAIFLLESAGYDVVIPDEQLCCGRAAISRGLLERVRVQARHNLDRLSVYVRRGWPIVGIEPSCLLTFRDDYRDLVADHPEVSAVADSCFLLEEFLAGLAAQGQLDIQFTAARRRILLHGHCHQKALVGTAPMIRVLRLPRNYQVEEIPSGCCGMAGSFGYEKEHYDLSMEVGEDRLFRAIRAAEPDTVIVAAGTSCRHQIADATGRRAVHWAEVLVEAL
ncbi:MAG: FAD-linked oxidase C-terminal domain-containing protein [Gemmatimonadota bacterium]